MMDNVSSIGYAEAEGVSWDEVRLAAVPKGRSPLSVHIPLNLPEASDLLFCDCAFNAWKMPVPPDMKTGGDARTAEIRKSLRLGLVSVALGEAPFVPEFRQTRWTRASGGYPIIRGEIDAQYRNYAFEYCTDPRDGELYIRCTVRNTGFEPEKAVVRLRRSEPLEKEICDYHYVTFRWDAERWLTGEATKPPQVVESDFDSAAFESEWSFGDDAYGIHPYFCGAPYFVHPAMRLKHGDDCLRFEAMLAPGESRTFTVAAGFAEGRSAALPQLRPGQRPALPEAESSGGSPAVATAAGTKSDSPQLRPGQRPALPEAESPRGSPAVATAAAGTKPTPPQLRPGQHPALPETESPGGPPAVAAAHRFDDICAAAKRFWDARLPVTADFGNARESNIFRSLQICNLQLLLNPWKDAASPYLQPCQGGSSERFYVWVWEAMFCLRPMARLGHFAEVRKVLEFILRLQDGGCPPEGEFTKLAGAIGTTGPRWANSTGAALMLAAEYLECADDADFEKRHLDNLVRAAKWILGETQATRKLRPDGSREIGYGLMPGCVVNDGDRGIFFATTDSYSYAGVRHLADFLLRRNHPEGAWMDAECARYKTDIDRTIAEVQRDDGFIPRMVGSDKDGSFEFRNIPGALGLVWSGTVDPATDERMARMVDYWEREHAIGPFMEPFDFGIRYIGNCESGIARYHALRREWKKAYFAREAFMNYAMTRDLHITGERYSEVDEGFTPWQPNASNNGRGLDMMIGRFLIDGGSRIVLMGGFAPFETADVSIVGLHTRFGRCSIVRHNGLLRAEWEHPLPTGLLVVIPEHLGFVPDTDMESAGVAIWKIISPSTVVSGHLTGVARCGDRGGRDSARPSPERHIRLRHSEY
ncbi:MAG: hypothetical protein IJK04_01410 [Kiritimatiellae bacterium]|nr:hypothetical protein [Kiritimatiellia bacterium]